MKNTPFKMKGFSGFVNSPLKQTGDTRDFVRSNRGGGLRPKNKKRGSGWWGRTGRKILKIVDKILPGGNDSSWSGNIKIGWGPRGCKL